MLTVENIVKRSHEVLIDIKDGETIEVNESYLKQNFREAANNNDFSSYIGQEITVDYNEASGRWSKITIGNEVVAERELTL